MPLDPLAWVRIPDFGLGTPLINDNHIHLCIIRFEIVAFSSRSLLVYIRAKQEFRHYDSLDSSNKQIARMLAYKLQPYVQGNKLLRSI